AKVDRDDIEWAISVAWAAGLALANTAMDYTPETERRIWSNKILLLIEQRGTLKIRDVQMHIRGALRSAEIKDMLAQLVEGGFIEWTVHGYRKSTIKV